MVWGCCWRLLPLHHCSETGAQSRSTHCHSPTQWDAPTVPSWLLPDAWNQIELLSQISQQVPRKLEWWDQYRRYIAETSYCDLHTWYLHRKCYNITISLMRVIVLLYMMTWSNTLVYSCDFFCVFFSKCFSLCFVLSDTYWHVSYSDAIDAKTGSVKWICMYVLLSSELWISK